MIYYLVIGKNSLTMRSFLNGMGSEFKDRVNIIPYESFRWQKRMAPGTYILSDVDRLPPRDARLYSELCDRLMQEPGLTVFNHPIGSMKRFELLSTLHEHGINSFNVYRLSDDPRPKSFPVFIRRMNDHMGNLTPLLFSQEELRRAAQRVRGWGQGDRDKMVVEFCDTSDSDGVFRKYSAFAVGDRIIPRHVFFGRNWMLKKAELCEREMVDEEIRFVEENPHEEELTEIFRRARIGYGRVDYAVLYGKVQIWEINTNPMIASFPSSIIPERKEVHRLFVRNFLSALDAIDTGNGPVGEMHELGAAGKPNPASPGYITAALRRAVDYSIVRYYYLKYKNSK